MKKITIAIVAVLLIGAVAFGGIATYVTVSSQKTFQEDGYILTGNSLNKGKIDFSAGTKFTVKKDYVTFKDVNGQTVRVDLDCFVHYVGGGVESFTDGVLMNFKDLSDNFINNYYIEANVIISPNEGGIGYVSNTNNEMQFGNYLLKLETGRYIVCAPNMYVHLSDTEQPEIEGFVEVLTSEDGIAYIRTAENAWTTIMDDFFIQIGEGDNAVKIYPTDGIVRNVNYAMSINKLAVDQDDAIVLSSAETRRQIVPRINVIAENGKNGSDGGDGNNGSNGTKGESGTSGLEGESGIDGTQGSQGTGGTRGNNGSDGEGGTEGSRGGRGGDGGDGTNVIGNSSTNAAIPVMTIKSWTVSATGVKGVIGVSGNLEALEVPATASNSFAGRVTIYKLNGAEQYPVYQCDAAFTSIDETGEFTAFASGADEVYFTSFSDESDYVPLSPDTGYRLSVVAYYKMNNATFSREFVSRVFYTDSTGVYLSTESVGVDSVLVKSTIGDGYYNSMATVEVFLLDSLQNANFTYLNRNAIGNYLQKFTLDYTTNTMSRYFLTYDAGGAPDLNIDQSYNGKVPDQVSSLLFPGLSHNKEYIVRVVISTKDGFNTLSAQQLNVTTLRSTPTWTLPVNASYSQATGALEVFRPADIFDPDGGITNFIYRAYQADGSFIQSHTISASGSDPIAFYLPANNTYYFEVLAVFEDNQKTVEYSLGKSEQITTYGATLPRVSITRSGSSSAQEYNQFIGYISIDLTNASTSLVVDNNHPLELQIYADQIYDTTIVIKNTNPVTLANSYSATYSDAVSSYAKIDLELRNLYKNHNYTITVTGSLNLGDGNGVVYRTIGSVSFRTYDIVSVTAVYNNSSATTGAINKMLQLVPFTTDMERKAYAISQLTQGQVTLTLFSGTGLAKSPMVSTVISDATSLAKIYGDGYDITEADFGNLTLSNSQDYTIGVTAVSDQTSKMKLGYVNSVDANNINNASLPITAQATPPDLPTDPTFGVKYAPILNIEAPSYGVPFNENLPEDAVVGYSLEASYDNVQRLGESVTYYVMEYAQFYNAMLNKTDPVGKDGIGVSKLVTMTQQFGASDKAPRVAVFFGGDHKSNDEEAREAYYNGHYVYWAGTVDYSMTTGMDRGYRYVFAYTAKYYSDGTFDETTMKVYPYDHPRYNGPKYKYYITYGAGYQNGTLLGSGVAYILNSGMIEVPKISPEIHSYVYNVTGTTAGTSLQYSNGTITIHYRFRDLDGTIVTTGAMVNRTQIIYGEQRIPINNTGTGSYGWYTATFNYDMEFGEGEFIFEPTLNISTYLFDYSSILLALGYPEEEVNMGYYLCHVPIEPDYKFLFAHNTYKDAFRVKILTDYLDENYLVFLVESLNGIEDLDLLSSRCYELKLSFKAAASGAVPEEDLGTYYFNTTLGYIGLDSEYGLYAKVSSGLFGNYLKRSIICEASLMIDNGDQGVELLETSPYFGVQYINTLNDGFGFDNYVSSVTGNSSLTPNGGLLSLSTNSNFKDADTLEATMANLSTKKKLNTRFNYEANLRDNQYYKYFYVDQFGLDVSESSDLEKLSGRYVTFKGVTELKLKFTGSNRTKIDTMTPVFQNGGHVTSTTQLMLRTSLNVSGAAENQDIFLAVYDTADHARGLVGTPLAITSFKVNASGSPIVPAGTSYIYLTVPDASSGGKYYYTLYTNVGSTPTVLIDYNTQTKFVQQFQLISDVAVESTVGLVFSNEGYFDKHADLIFSLSSYIGFELRYDLFASQEEAEAGVNVLYNEQDVIMNDPIPSAQNNRFWINLQPSRDRNKLVPGGNYVLRVRVLEKSSGFQVGCNYFPLRLPAASNSGAVIYVDKASQTSITYKVTLFDPSFVFMAPAETADGQMPSLYAVRFEKEDGTRLVTDYDYQLYSGNTLKQTFVLNDDVLTWNGTVAGQEIGTGKYMIRIYAVPDYNHDGLSNPISAEANDVKDYNWFFTNMPDGSVDATNFFNLLDSFWDASLKNDRTKDSIENGFLIGSKLQATTDDSGLLVNADNVTGTRKGNYLQMVFAESFGFLYEYNGQKAQTFSKIEYYVSGTADNGKAINVEGVVNKAAGDEMFKETIDNAGYSIYTFQIPEVVANGSVMITLKMYKTTNPTEQPITISKTYRG